MARVHIPALTGLCFVAALMVILDHGFPMLRFEDDIYIWGLVGPLAASAMPLFFVLSGVVLWFNYGERFRQEAFFPTLWGFCVARFARLYPLLLAVVLIGFAMSKPGRFVAALPGSPLYPLVLTMFVRSPQAETSVLGVLHLTILLAMATATILVFASGSYAVVEVPARRWLRRRLNAPGGGRLALGGVGCGLAAMVAMWFYGADLAFPYRAARLADLDRVQLALSAYRHDHGFYPPSPAWSGLYWPDTPGENWLPGLVPGYLASLPRGPRRTAIPHAQYIYRSVGNDYKLLSMLPEDCKLTVYLIPRLADPARNVGAACIAYGYWTAGAATW